MLVPENQQQRTGHVISMYLATCGANGHLLGSDEKEIIYLVFGIIDLQLREIIGIKQYLVRPSSGFQCNSLKSASPNTSAASSESGSIPSTSYTEPLIAEAVLQANGRPLNDVINDFDTYLRSLKIDQNNICLVTDGQQPLRQCLHPESGAKDINLPSYYWKFNDLRKEYGCSKPDQDSSRSTVPIADVKLPNMPAVSTTQSISLTDILNEMELKPCADSDFYIKESRDMITIVQSMIIAGHNFNPNEVVNQSLEPGICSIDDEIDGNCIVRARGLPWQSSDQDIAKFFRGLNVAKGGVALCLSPQGRRNGEALIRFISQEHRDMALKRHKHHIGSRYIEVYRATGEDFLAVAGGASNEAQTFLSKGAQVIIRMRGLPYDCTANQVLEFFANGENSCKVLDESEGILFVKKPDGRSTGDAFVLFADESDAPKALSKHRESIGQRYIELFRSTIAEVQQVLNRSMDPKTYEQNTPKPPLIAQIPPTIAQMPMLPQHVITSGTEKNCIRLRGLPYEAKVEHILHFLEDFAKHIVYQGVHLVYNAQGQFNGEAFIQMDSESAAQASAQQKHHKHMMFGKKQRYIEVFQCSGEDMNIVLNGSFIGGYHHQSSPTITAKPISSGMLPQPSRPQTSTVQPLQVSIPPPLTIPLSIPQTVLPPTVTNSIPAINANVNVAVGSASHGQANPNSLIAQQQQQAHFIAQQNLIARQQAAAAQLHAAQQQSADQMAFLQNYSFLSSPSAASNLQTPPTQMATNPYAAYSLGPQVPQFYYLPRPMLPMSLMHPNIGQLSAASFAGALPSGYVNSAQLQSVQNANAQMMQNIPASSAISSTSVKRSYESAFRNDPMTVTAAKRAYHPSQSHAAANLYGNSMLAPFPGFNQYPPPTQIYSSPPQIFYFAGYHPNGPISPTYIQPLPIPPHAFHHFPPDRPTLFPEMDVEMQVIPPPTSSPSIQQQQQPPPIKQLQMASPVGPSVQHQHQQQQQPLPNQVKVMTNFNFQYDDNGNLGRVDVSKALCYQSQEISNNLVTKKVLVMHQKKAPILLAGPNIEQQEQTTPQQYLDCNNNNMNPLTQLPSTVIDTAHLQPPAQQIFTPKNMNPQFIQPPFINHLNWNPQFQ